MHDAQKSGSNCVTVKCARAHARTHPLKQYAQSVSMCACMPACVRVCLHVCLCACVVAYSSYLWSEETYTFCCSIITAA